MHGLSHRNYAERAIGICAGKSEPALQHNAGATINRFLNLLNVNSRIVRSDDNGWTHERFSDGTRGAERKNHQRLHDPARLY